MVWIIANEDKLNSQNYIEKILRESNLSKDDILNVYYDDDIITNLSQVSLTSNEKIVIIKNATKFLSKNDSKIIDLINFIDNDYRDFILVSECKVNGEIFDQFKQQKMKIISINNFTNKTKKDFIINELTKHDIHLANEQINYFVNNVNNSPDVILNEINKIKTFLADNKNFLDNDLKRLVCNYSDENIFLLLENIIKKNFNQTFKIYDDLIGKNNDELLIIASISYQLNQFYMIKKMLVNNINTNDIIKKLNIQQFVFNNIEKNIKLIKLDELIKILDTFFNLELSIKTMKIDKKIGFKKTLLSLLI